MYDCLYIIIGNTSVNFNTVKHSNNYTLTMDHYIHCFYNFGARMILFSNIDIFVLFIYLCKSVFHFCFTGCCNCCFGTSAEFA